MTTTETGPPTSTDWWQECERLCAEIERLRAEAQDDAEQHDRLLDDWGKSQAKNEELRAERDWLKSEWEAMARERDDLRAALAKIANAHLDGERRLSWAQDVATDALARYAAGRVW